MLRAFVFGSADAGKLAIIDFDNITYAPSSNTRGQDHQRWQCAKTYRRAQRTRNDILQEVGAAPERLNHPRSLWISAIADWFDFAEGSSEPA